LNLQVEELKPLLKEALYQITKERQQIEHPV
jgi:hypothetical protein